MTALTQTEINDFATKWYHNLDIHVPLEDYKSLLVDEALTLQFPEGTFTGFDGFREWYEPVIRKFFDEVHTIKEVTLTSVAEEYAYVKVIVNWQASIWNPPSPKSERIVLDAYQTWKVVRSRITQEPVIATYIVDSIKYAEGSAKL
ncbi:MAG: hypothetical protein QNJ08_20885 [Crocosphaera sp.]|nr:hypothetical protein [Crocosphaera sp.]